MFTLLSHLPCHAYFFHSYWLLDTKFISPSLQDGFEKWFLGFWHQRSKSVQVEMEVTTLESAIAEERRKIAQLCRRLGLELTDEEEEESNKNDLGEKQLYD